METTVRELRSSPVVDRTAIAPGFVSRLFRDILQFGEDVQIQVTAESGRIATFSKEEIHEAHDGLANGRFEAVEIHYYYSGCLWCDRLSLGSSGLELTRNREWFGN